MAELVGRLVQALSVVSSTAWQIAFSAFSVVGMVSVAVWIVYLYVVLLSQGSRGAVLTLSRLERRFASAAKLQEETSHRPWRRFRVKHLATAQGVRRAQRWIFRPASWTGLVVLVDLLGLAVLLAGASITHDLPRPWEGVAFALAFFSAVPWLLTALLERVLWHRRTRSEWEVALLGEELANDASKDVDQDYIGRRTARIVCALGRRLPGKSARRGHTTEGCEWLVKTQRPVEMRAELLTTDMTERRRWTTWVASWLDAVSESFDSRPPSGRSTADPVIALPSSDPDTQGLGVLTAICCGLGAVGIVLAVSSEGFDAAAVLAAWDSTAGRLTTFFGLVGAVLSIVSFRRR